MSETYSVDCVCSNCGKSESVSLPKGTPCSGQLLCPNCGCVAATKKAEYITPQYPTWPNYTPPTQPIDWGRIYVGDIPPFGGGSIATPCRPFAEITCSN